MNRNELLELIANGENSSVEFKREEISSEMLAREMVAFSNLNGGRILIGVDDDRFIRGFLRKDLEEWIMNIARENVFPPVVPHYEVLENFEDGKRIAIITLSASPAKPCRAIIKNRKIPFIRIGSTVREASDEELMQMLQANQRLNFGKIYLPGTDLNSLYLKRIRQYLENKLGMQTDYSEDEFIQILQNFEMLQVINGQNLATINGILLFGKNPKKYLFQAGIRALVYKGIEESYEVLEDATLDEPLIPDIDQHGRICEYGLIERTIHFIGKYCPPPDGALDHARNVRTTEFPDDLLRELLVNSVVHRDYTISGADIMLSIFSNRLEIKTPGRLPNGATVESIKKGYRYYRNQTLVNVMRDYGYVDARGMGIRLKIIPKTIEFSGKEPEFIASDVDFTVVIPRLMRKPL